MASETTPSKSPRQAFFAHFSHQVLQALESLLRTPTSPPTPLILLTGGLLTPGLLRTVLNSRHAHLLGIGRGSVLCPNLPSILKEKNEDLLQWDDIPFQREPDLRLPHILEYWPLNWMWSLAPKIRLIGAGVGMAWYVVTIRCISRASRSGSDLVLNHDMGGLEAVFWMWAWIPVREKRLRDLCWLGCLHFFFIIITIISIHSFL